METKPQKQDYSSMSHQATNSKSPQKRIRKKLKNHAKSVPSRRKKPQKKPQRPPRSRQPASSPPQIRRGSPEFASLVAKWYTKLAETGFKDLERPNPRTGLIEPNNMLHGQSLHTLSKLIQNGTQQALFYKMLENFLTHCPDWSLDPWHRLAAKRISEGVPYSKIAAEGFALGYLKTPNKWFVWKLGQTFIPMAIKWNKKSPEGVYFDTDFYF
jgi:hypothetical protein